MKNVTAVFAVLMLIFAGLACSGDDTEKANALVDEANKFVTEANKNVVDAEAKGKEFDTKVAAIKSNEDHDKASEFGKTELVPLYDKMKDNFQKAGDKFDEAGKMKLNDKYKEYLQLKGSEFKKRAEYAEALKAIPKTLTDSKDEKAYNEAVVKDVDNSNKLLQDAKDIETKATKIQTDNPTIFKKQ